MSNIKKLDKETVDTLPLGYVAGCLVAIIEQSRLQTPPHFVRLVTEDMTKLDTTLVAALAQEAQDGFIDDPELGVVSTDSDLVELADRYYKLRDTNDPKQSIRLRPISETFYIGYYHQRSRNDKRKNRKAAGEQIKKARLKQNRTLHEMAELTGIDRNIICRIEAGRYNATVDELSQLSAVLGLKLALMPTED